MGKHVDITEEYEENILMKVETNPETSVRRMPAMYAAIQNLLYGTFCTGKTHILFILKKFSGSSSIRKLNWLHDQKNHNKYFFTIWIVQGMEFLICVMYIITPLLMTILNS